MSEWSIWLVIVGLTAMTIATRSFFLVLGDRIPLSERVQSALRYAPVCALTALIAPELLGHPLAEGWTIFNPKLTAALVAVVIIMTTRSVVAAMILAMVAFTLLR